MLVSYFQSLFKPCFYVESAPIGSQYIHFADAHGHILMIFYAVKKLKWKKAIELQHTKKGGWSENKKNIPCFTPSGMFRIRCDWDLIEYSQIIHLDFDKVDNPAGLRDRLAKSKYTYAAFVSPGGFGVKVFVRVNSRADAHQIAFMQVRAMYDDLAGIKSDPSVSNLSRLCFVGADADCFINTESKVFDVAEVKTSVTIPDVSILADSKSIFGYLYNLTMKGKYQGEILGEYGGRRNNFLFVFACNCNRYGLDQPIAYEFMKSIWIQNNMGFTMNELSATLMSGYKNKAEHATFRLPKNLIL